MVNEHGRTLGGGVVKLIIAGGRNYQMTQGDIITLNNIHTVYGVTEVVSGGARGADKGGEIWAFSKGITTKIFEADWDQHGRAAGPIRNMQMAEYATGLALFAGGRGSENMFKTATKLGLAMFDFRVIK